MSLKSIVRELKEMRDGIGSMSRRGVESRRWNGRTKSHVAPDVILTSLEPIQQGQWANLPPELLLDIIRRVEDSETTWPARAVVVYCGSVCKSWRAVTKEIVKTPEQCGRLTFPISLKQPGPRDSPIQCFIRRNRETSTYLLYIGLVPSENETDKLLLAAKKVRRATGTDFVISLVADDFFRSSNTYVGKLRSNFLGTKFTIYDSQPPQGAAIQPDNRSSRRFHIPMAAKTVTPDAVSTLLANPSPDSTSDLPDIVVQVLDLKATGNKYMFTANDGKTKLKAMIPSDMRSQVLSGAIQNLGLIRVLDYTVNDIPNKSDKYLLAIKCEAVSPALEMEIKSEESGSGILLKPKVEGGVKTEGAAAGILLKPKQEVVTKSANQILREQHGNSAPAARMAMTRRVRPLVSLNPYQGNWTIKVSVTSKGNMRTYKNARGDGCVFNVELTDEDGTQIQATMFNNAARKFFDKFVLGKVYYISRGTLKVANKQFKTVQNDYEMTLNENSEVEEVVGEASFVPETKFNFVQIDQLGPHVNKSELVDVIGVVKNVSSTMSIRRKSDNESIPKRDITIADDTKKTVVVSLWNELATTTGEELLDIVDKSPVVAIKSLKVGDFQGVSLSTIGRSVVLVNPDIPEAKNLRSWYDFEGKDAAMDSVGSGSSPISNNGIRSVYTDRIHLSDIISNPSLGDGKPAFFSLRGHITFIKPDQAMWYRACKTCNKKVTESFGSGYWCDGCQKSDEQCSLRYIMVAKVSDGSAETFISVFNQEAEKIVGCSADDLDNLKLQEGEDNPYQMTLKEATWAQHLFRVSVTPNEYNGEKRQRITVRAVVPVDFAAESRFILEELSKMRA